MPRVSVIIPTYNRADYLPITLDSVLGQTFRDREVIVVDDGSTDHTSEVLERYAGRVRCLRQTNQREGAARNYGIRESEGELLAFLDSDDVWLPNKLEEDLRALEQRPRAALVYSRFAYISSSGEWLGESRLQTPEGDVFDRLVHENFIGLSTVTVRRAPFESVGLFRTERELSGSFDWEAWVRLAAFHPFAHVPRVTTWLRVHPRNMLSDGSYMERAMLRAAELFLTNPALQPRLRGKHARVRASLYLAIAVNHYGNGDMASARRYLARAVQAWPPTVAEPRLVATFLKSLLGARLAFRLRRSKRWLTGRSARQGRAW